MLFIIFGGEWDIVGVNVWWMSFKGWFFIKIDLSKTILGSISCCHCRFDNYKVEFVISGFQFKIINKNYNFKICCCKFYFNLHLFSKLVDEFLCISPHVATWRFMCLFHLLTSRCFSPKFVESSLPSCCFSKFLDL